MKYLITLLVLILYSCNDNKNEIKRELDFLNSKPVVISKNIQITNNGQDTTINDFLDSKVKMVIYTNSESCNGCALSKLHMWNDIIKYSEPFDGALKCYFIFNPPKGESIRFSLKSSMLDYPVLLDSLGEFERLNPHLPKNRAMHTFLLDENNNVILVGNPLTNKQIEKMFYEEVEKRLK